MALLKDEKEDAKLQYCPICNKQVSFKQRYPKYVCDNCYQLTNDETGQPVKFFNTEVLGFGCGSEYRETKEIYESTYCFIGGLKCKAEEGHFGGIVIQLV